MLRKCRGTYSEWNNEVKRRVSIDFENGIFHEWGFDYEEFESGGVSYSIAIVELPDGKVITARPEHIKFIK